MASSYGSLFVTIRRIALIGGVTTFGLYQTVPFILGYKIRTTEQYKKAIELLRSHPEAMKHLGEPLKEYRVNTMWEKDYGSDKEKAWFNIPIKGSNSKGKLYCEFPLHNIKDKNVKFTKLELTLEKIPDYKLQIKDSY